MLTKRLFSTVAVAGLAVSLAACPDRRDETFPETTPPPTTAPPPATAPPVTTPLPPDTPMIRDTLLVDTPGTPGRP